MGRNDNYCTFKISLKHAGGAMGSGVPNKRETKCTFDKYSSASWALCAPYRFFHSLILVFLLEEITVISIFIERTFLVVTPPRSNNTTAVYNARCCSNSHIAKALQLTKDTCELNITIQTALSQAFQSGPAVGTTNSEDITESLPAKQRCAFYSAENMLRAVR